MKVFTPAAMTALVLSALAFVQAQNVAKASLGPDFYHYWVVPRVAGTPGADVFAAESRRAIGRAQLEEARRDRASPGRARAAIWNSREYPDLIAPTGTPLFYAFFGLLVSDAYDRDLARYQLVANLAFFVALLALCRMLGFALPIAGGLSVLFTVWFEPFIADVKFANSNRLLFASVVLYLAVLKRSDTRMGSLAAGIVLGAIVLFKPSVFAIPLLLSALWLIQRRFERCIAHTIGLAAGSLLAVATGSYVFGGWECWPAWLGSLQRFAEGSRPDVPMLNNISTARILLESTGWNVSGLLGSVLAMGAIAWLWKQRAPRSGRGQFAAEAWATSVACALPLIAAPIAWTHYFVLAIPILLYPARPGGPAARERIAAIGAIAILVASGFSFTSAFGGLLGPGSRMKVAVGISGLLAASLALAAWRLGEDSREARSREDIRRDPASDPPHAQIRHGLS